MKTVKKMLASTLAVAVAAAPGLSALAEEAEIEAVSEAVIVAARDLESATGTDDNIPCESIEPTYAEITVELPYIDDSNFAGEGLGEAVDDADVVASRAAGEPASDAVAADEADADGGTGGIAETLTAAGGSDEEPHEAGEIANVPVITPVSATQRDDLWLFEVDSLQQTIGFIWTCDGAEAFLAGICDSEGSTIYEAETAGRALELPASTFDSGDVFTLNLTAAFPGEGLGEAALSFRVISKNLNDSEAETAAGEAGSDVEPLSDDDGANASEDSSEAGGGSSGASGARKSKSSGKSGASKKGKSSGGKSGSSKPSYGKSKSDASGDAAAAAVEARAGLLILDGTPIDIALDGGLSEFTVELKEHTLRLTPAGGSEAWQIGPGALDALIQCDIGQLELVLEDQVYTVRIRSDASPSEALQSSENTVGELTWTFTADGVTAARGALQLALTADRTE